MRLSIITVTYNSAATLAETINSILSQEDVDLEYLIIDGVSTDGTLDIIKKYATQDPRIRWVSEPDEGIADAFNKGLALASGDWIGILNSDDYYAPGTLAAVAEAVVQNSGIEVVHGDMLRLDEHGEPVFVLKPAGLKTMWWRMALNHPATFVSRTAYDKVGEFDKTLKIAMDYDLVLRLYRSGTQFLYLERVLTHMRYGGVSDEQLWNGLRELHKVTVRQGYPRWKATGWMFWRLGEGLFKRLLRQIGLQQLQKFHPRFKAPD